MKEYLIQPAAAILSIYGLTKEQHKSVSETELQFYS